MGEPRIVYTSGAGRARIDAAAETALHLMDAHSMHADVRIAGIDPDGPSARAPARRPEETAVVEPAVRPTPESAPGTALAPVIACGVLGIAILTVAYALARANSELALARNLFWVAVALIYAPAMWRMLSASTPRAQRIAIVAMTAVFLYWIKVLHEPVRLFFWDELVHLADTQRVIDTGRLYPDNTILEVSSRYPALHIAAAALSQVSGMSVFASALIVIGLARVGLMVGLFLAFERLSQSARVAGVATLLYCTYPNYLFWSAQFSYESLSLPLLVTVLVCVFATDGASPPVRRAWTAAAFPVIAVVAPTHHLTSYALAVMLWIHVALAKGRRWPGVHAPVAMAVVATLAPVVWLTVSGGDTGGYLGSIFRHAGESVAAAFGNVGSTRAPFQGSGGSLATPPEDRFLAVASILLVAVGVGTGVVAARAYRWRNPFAWALGVAAVAAVASFGFRAFPDAWETANRSTSFLFIGASIMAAVVLVRFVDARPFNGRRLAAAAAATIAVMGGVVLGWPATARLPRPFVVDARGDLVYSQSILLQRWAQRALPRDSAFVVDGVNGRLLNVGGFNRIWAGREAARELLTMDHIPPWQWAVLRRERIDYVVLDRRTTALDGQAGYFFERPWDRGQYVRGWLEARAKYDALPGSQRVFDSGDIVVYDVRRPLRRPDPPSDA